MEDSSLILLNIGLILLILLGSYLSRIGSKLNYKKSVSELNENNTDIVLYLRDFRIDGNPVLKFGGPLAPVNKGFAPEKMLADIFAPAGAPLGLGRPGSKGQGTIETGPVLQYVDDTEWKAEVLKYMEIAYIIILMPSMSESVQWEIEQIINKGYLNKTVWYFNFRHNNILRQTKWYETFQKNPFISHIDFPKLDTKKPFLYIDNNNQPVMSGYFGIIHFPLLKAKRETYEDSAGNLLLRQFSIFIQIQGILILVTATLVSSDIEMLLLAFAAGLLIFFVVRPTKKRPFFTLK